MNKIERLKATGGVRILEIREWIGSKFALGVLLSGYGLYY